MTLAKVGINGQSWFWAKMDKVDFEQKKVILIFQNLFDSKKLTQKKWLKFLSKT